MEQKYEVVLSVTVLQEFNCISFSQKHLFYTLAVSGHCKEFLIKFQIDCGFSADLLSVLKKRVSTMSEKDRLCNVCIDEMSLKCGLHYNVSKDRIDGFVNMDCGGSQEISKQALVFMVTGLASNWKQPIGFFLVKTTASAHVLQTLLSECLTRLFDIGLCVKSVIFDQGASNQKLVKLLDATVETPFFVMMTKKCLFYSTHRTY